jgi:flagellar biosynthesis/type III secretory pathway M-ring protein FliF/YscJ
VSVFLFYFGWPDGAVWSNLLASLVCVGLAWWRLRVQAVRHHVEQLAQAGRHHREQLEQQAAQHEELKRQVGAHCGDVKAHVSAVAPPGAAGVSQAEFEVRIRNMARQSPEDFGRLLRQFVRVHGGTGTGAVERAFGGRM